MRSLLITAAVLVMAAGPAMADVIINDSLSGTGDNVVFQSSSSTQVVGTFNGTHQGLVDFNCLAGCTNFVGAQSGNDLKITADGLTNLSVQVFDTSLNALATSTDVFSITGTGDVTVGVTANETDGSTKLFTFDLLSLFGPLGPGQNGFTLTGINGETINKFTLLDQGGTITDFEHYRVDVAPAAVPGPEVGTGTTGMLGAMFVMWVLHKRRRNQVAA